MHKVEVMTQMPGTCLHCGRGNTPDDPDSIDDFWAIDLERDVNWGDSTYICRYCCDQLAQTAGYVTIEQLGEQQLLAEKLRKDNHELQAEFDSYKRRVQSIIRGRKSEKSIREDKPPAKAQPRTKKQRAKAA